MRARSSTKPFSLCVVVVVTFWCYTSSLHGEWTFDDNFAVVGNADVKLDGNVGDLFVHDFWGQDISKPDSHKSYRPITSLSFRLNYWFGSDTFGFHLVNVLLHCMVTVGVYFVAHYLLHYHWISFLSSILFGTHPIHTEAVSSIVGRAEILCTLFYIGAILAYKELGHHSGIKSKLLLVTTVVCVWMSTLSKETGFTIIAVLIVQDLLLLKKSGSFARILLLLLSGGVYLLLRKWLTVSFTLHNFRHLENPIAFADSGVTRIFSLAHLHARYALLLVFPLHLSADYSFNAIPLVESVSDIRNGLSLVVYGTIIVAFVLATLRAANSIDRSANTLLYLLVFGAVSFLPATNILFYVGTMLAERLLYLPSLAYCILLAWSIVYLVRLLDRKNTSSNMVETSVVSTSVPRIRHRIKYHHKVANSTTIEKVHPQSRAQIFARGLLLLCACTLLVFYVWRTRTRDYEWNSEHSLFMSAAEVCPGSAKVWQNVGILYRRNQEWERALECFARAQHIEPSYCELDYWVGLTLLNKGILWEALPLLSKSIDCIYTRVQAVQALHTIYSTLVATSAQNATLYTQWGKILRHINRTSEAAAQYYQAGILYHNAQKFLFARDELRTAVDLFTQSASEAHNTAFMLCRARLWLSATLRQLGDIDSAINQLELTTVPECAELHQDILPTLVSMFLWKLDNGTLTHHQRLAFADALAQANHTERAARQYLEAGIGLRAGNIAANIGSILRAFTRAIELTMYVPLEALHAEALYWNAVIHWELGNFGAAKDLLKKAAKTSDPHIRKLALNNLAVLA